MHNIHNACTSYPFTHLNISYSLTHLSISYPFIHLSISYPFTHLNIVHLIAGQKTRPHRKENLTATLSRHKLRNEKVKIHFLAAQVELKVISVVRCYVVCTVHGCLCKNNYTYIYL